MATHYLGGFHQHQSETQRYQLLTAPGGRQTDENTSSTSVGHALPSGFCTQCNHRDTTVGRSTEVKEQNNRDPHTHLGRAHIHGEAQRGVTGLQVDIIQAALTQCRFQSGQIPRAYSRQQRHSSCVSPAGRVCITPNGASTILTTPGPLY